MSRAIRSAIALAAISLLYLFSTANAGEPVPGNPGARADQPPRKVVVATVIYGPYGEYPGLDARLKELSGLIDQMAERASEAIPGARSGPGDPAGIGGDLDRRCREGSGRAAEGQDRGDLRRPGAEAQELSPHPVRPGRGGAGRTVLLERRGALRPARAQWRASIASVIRWPTWEEPTLEDGITPGRDTPVFDCDFGRLGVQICWDIQFADGWDALGRAGAEIVAWPTASPATVAARRPRPRAPLLRCFEHLARQRDDLRADRDGRRPDPAAGADPRPPARPELRHPRLDPVPGQRTRRSGRSSATRLASTIPLVKTWDSSGPTTRPRRSVTMIRSIGGEGLDEQVERNRRLSRRGRRDGRPPGSADVSEHRRRRALTTSGQSLRTTCMDLLDDPSPSR